MCLASHAHSNNYYVKKNLGDVLLHFRVNAADFFTACRTFVCVCAKPLREILGEETNARKKQKTDETTTTTMTTTKEASYSPSALQLDADDSEDLEIAEMKRLEQFLGMDNLRASFAFSKVIATKFEQFCKTHFRVDELLGRAYCWFAWNAFSLTKVKLGTSLFEDAENDDDYDYDGCENYETTTRK